MPVLAAKPAPTTAIRDSDRDSLYILPLAMIPLETPGLRRARMIKNAHLESVIELFSGSETGSGQIKLEALGTVFSDIAPADFVSLRKLAKLPSFDVYSLRITLRQLGIAVNDHSALRLSKSKEHELTEYMREFTRQLIFNVYGDHERIDSFDDVLALFRHPDVRRARDNLRRMAERLNIVLDEVPRFLADYGDTYLSVSYYHQCLDLIRPAIQAFLDAVDEIRQHHQLRADANLIRSCNRVDANVRRLVSLLNLRFEQFSKATSNMWDNITAERFHSVRTAIESNHVNLGGALCMLTVKMNAWTQRFPHRLAGGPMKWAEFVVTDMRPGLDRG